MIYFKLPQTGQIFAYDSQDEYEQYGLPDLVPLTDEELYAHNNPPPPVISIIDQISNLEIKYDAPRWWREFAIGTMEYMAAQVGKDQGLTPEQAIATLRAGNKGYREIKELDEQIAELRKQL